MLSMFRWVEAEASRVALLGLLMVSCAWSTPDLRLSVVLSMFCWVEAEASLVALLGLLMASCAWPTPDLRLSAVLSAFCWAEAEASLVVLLGLLMASCAWSTPDLRLSAVLSMFRWAEAEASLVALLGLLMASSTWSTPDLMLSAALSTFFCALSAASLRCCRADFLRPSAPALHTILVLATTALHSGPELKAAHAGCSMWDALSVRGLVWEMDHCSERPMPRATPPGSAGRSGKDRGLWAHATEVHGAALGMSCLHAQWTFSEILYTSMPCAALL